MILTNMAELVKYEMDDYKVIYAPERGGHSCFPYKVIAKSNPSQHHPYHEGRTVEEAEDMMRRTVRDVIIRRMVA